MDHGHRACGGHRPLRHIAVADDPWPGIRQRVSGRRHRGRDVGRGHRSDRLPDGHCRELVGHPGRRETGTRRSWSGVVAFSDIAFIRIYNLWADGENERILSAMRAAGCPGYAPPASPIIWPHWTEIPAHALVAAYAAGVSRIVAEITLEPVGTPPARWSNDTVHLETGQTFWVLWRTVNADTAELRGTGPASQVLVAAGHPASGIMGTSGSVRLVAPAQPAVVEFTLEASNAACGAAQLPPRLVVTGPALQPVTIVVQQSLPGGDVDVVPGDIAGSGFISEALKPPDGLSIPPVAQSARRAIDRWTASARSRSEFPTAEASLRMSGPAIPWSAVTLRPGTSTANPPPTAADPPVALRSGRPFSSVLEYGQWIAQNVNNNPATFNVVLPSELCIGQITLEATGRVRNQAGRIWTATATRTVKFHRRRGLRIRYRPWGQVTNLRPARTASPTQPAIPAQPANPAPTDQQCEAALRAAGSLLPIPDPEIVRLSGPAFDADTNDKPI